MRQYTICGRVIFATSYFRALEAYDELFEMQEDTAC